MSEVDKDDPDWRAFAGAVAKDAAERAVHAGDIEEQLADVGNLQGLQGGLPVQFVDDHMMPTQRLFGKRAPIVAGATARDVENFARAPTRVCGTCRHFQLQEGRKEIAKQRFLERIVLEDKWKMQHLGAPPDHLGICGQKPSMATSTVSNAGNCNGYQPRDGIFRR
jgi:hypothetical protein